MSEAPTRITLTQRALSDVVAVVVSPYALYWGYRKQQAVRHWTKSSLQSSKEDMLLGVVLSCMYIQDAKDTLRFFMRTHSVKDREIPNKVLL